MTTTSAIIEEQKAAERDVLEVLHHNKGAALNTREIIQELRARGHSYTADTVLGAVWSLVEGERLQFTDRRELILREDGKSPITT